MNKKDNIKIIDINEKKITKSIFSKYLKFNGLLIIRNLFQQDDIVDELNTKQLIHAVLDVFEEQPLMASSHLWQNDNISILPHISAPTHRESAVHIVVNNITHFMKDGVIPKAISKVKGY